MKGIYFFKIYISFDFSLPACLLLCAQCSIDTKQPSRETFYSCCEPGGEPVPARGAGAGDAVWPLQLQSHKLTTDNTIVPRYSHHPQPNNCGNDTCRNQFNSSRSRILIYTLHYTCNGVGSVGNTHSSFGCGKSMIYLCVYRALMPY